MIVTTVYYRTRWQILLAVLAASACVGTVRGEDAFDQTLPQQSVAEELFVSPDGLAFGSVLDAAPMNATPFGDEQEFRLLDEPAPTYSSGEWLFSGGWYFQQDVVVLQKAELADRLLAVDGTNTALQLLTSTDQPTYEPGARITLGKIYGRDAWNRDHMVEFRFFGLFDWPTQAGIVRTQAIAGNGINTALGPPFGDVLALFGNESQRVTTQSSLDNYEINFRMRTRGSRDRMVLQHDGEWIRHQTHARIWSCYTGLTSFFIDDRFDLRGVGEGATRGQYTVSTSNNLVGLHFGGEYIEQAALWNWGVRGRLAGLANFADRRSTFTSQVGANAPTTRTEQSDKDNLTFLFEGGIFTSVQLHENATLRVGYDLLWLIGVAQPHGNINLPVGNFTPLNVSDEALYHGGSVGLTLVW